MAVDSLDILIGNENYLGKGLSVQTINAFMEYIKVEIDPSVDRFVIDPEIINNKAIHIYQKAGFQIVKEFIADEGKFEGKAHYLMVKRL